MCLSREHPLMHSMLLCGHKYNNCSREGTQGWAHTSTTISWLRIGNSAKRLVLIQIARIEVQCSIFVYKSHSRAFFACSPVSYVYLSCLVATLPLTWFIDFAHSFLSTLGVNNSKMNETNISIFFTSTSNEIIIALSKFHRDLNLSSYFSTNFPCQIQGASYPSRVKGGDFQN